MASVEAFLDTEIRSVEAWCERRGRANNLEARLEAMMEDMADQWQREDEEEAAAVQNSLAKQLATKASRSPAATPLAAAAVRGSAAGTPRGGTLAATPARPSSPQAEREREAVLAAFEVASPMALPPFASVDRQRLVAAAVASFAAAPPHPGYLERGDLLATSEAVLGCLVKKGEGGVKLQKLRNAAPPGSAESLRVAVGQVVQVLNTVLATLHDGASAHHNGPIEAAVRLYKNMYGSVVRVLHEPWVDAAVLHAVREQFSAAAASKDGRGDAFTAACDALIDDCAVGLGRTHAARDGVYLACVQSEAIDPVRRTVDTADSHLRGVDTAADSAHSADWQGATASSGAGKRVLEVGSADADHDASLATVFKQLERTPAAAEAIPLPAAATTTTVSLQTSLREWGGAAALIEPLPQPRQLARRLVCGILDPLLGGARGYLNDDEGKGEAPVSDLEDEEEGVEVGGDPARDRPGPTFTGELHASPAPRVPGRRATDMTVGTEFSIASSAGPRSSHFSIYSSEFPASSEGSIYETIHEALVGRVPWMAGTPTSAGPTPQAAADTAVNEARAGASLPKPSSATRRLSREMVEESIAKAVKHREQHAARWLARGVVARTMAAALQDAVADDAFHSPRVALRPDHPSYISQTCVNDGVWAGGAMVCGGRLTRYPYRILRVVASLASTVAAAAVAAYVAYPQALDDCDMYAVGGAMLQQARRCDINGFVEKYGYAPAIVRLATGAARFYAAPRLPGNSGEVTDAPPGCHALMDVFIGVPDGVLRSVLPAAVAARVEREEGARPVLCVAAAFELLMATRRIALAGGVAAATDVFVPLEFCSVATAAIAALHPVVRDLAEGITQMSVALQARLMRDCLTRIDRGALTPPLPFNVLSWARAFHAAAAKGAGMVWAALGDAEWRRGALDALRLRGVAPPGALTAGASAKRPCSRESMLSVATADRAGRRHAALLYEDPHGTARGTDADLTGVVYVVMVEWGRPVRAPPGFWKHLMTCVRLCVAGRLHTDNEGTLLPRLRAAVAVRDGRVLYRRLCEFVRAVERSAAMQEEWATLATAAEAMPFQPPPKAEEAAPSPRRSVSRSGRKASFAAPSSPAGSSASPLRRRRSTIGIRRKSLGSLVAALKFANTAARRRRSLFGAADPTWNDMDGGGDNMSVAPPAAEETDPFAPPPCTPERRRWCRVLQMPPEYHYIPVVVACQYYGCYFRAFVMEDEGAPEAELLSPRQLDAYKDAYIHLNGAEGEAGAQSTRSRRGSLMHPHPEGASADDAGLRWRRATQRLVGSACPLSIHGGAAYIDLGGIDGFGDAMELGAVVDLAIHEVMAFSAYDAAHSAAMFVEVLASVVPAEAFLLGALVHPLRECANNLLDSLDRTGSAEDFLTQEIANSLLACIRAALQQRDQANRFEKASAIQRAWRCARARKSRRGQAALDYPTMGLFMDLARAEAAAGRKLAHMWCLRAANTAILPQKLQRKREGYVLDELENEVYTLQQRVEKLPRVPGGKHDPRQHLRRVAELEGTLAEMLETLKKLLPAQQRYLVIKQVVILLCRVLVAKVAAEKLMGGRGGAAAVEEYFNTTVAPLLGPHVCVPHGAPVALACGKAYFEAGDYARAEQLCQQAMAMTPRNTLAMDDIEEFRTACTAVRSAHAVAKQAQARVLSPARAG